MGRKSKLTADQKAEAQRRRLQGESWRSIAKDFGVSDSALREAISAQTAQIETVAKQIVATERALTGLPISAQITAHNLASKLRSISDSLASAAELGAKTAHRLHALANSEVNKVEDANPMASIENLRNVGVLTKLANESAVIGTNLLSGAKEVVKEMHKEARPLPQRVAVVVEDASVPDAETQ